MSPWHDVVTVVIVAMMCGTLYLIVEKENNGASQSPPVCVIQGQP